jgi:hypothetical protein
MSGRPQSGHAGRLPDFFVVGAPKAGTTSLYRYLGQHPEIFLSPLKEPCYFAPEIHPDAFSEQHRAFVDREAKALRKYLDGPMSDEIFGGIVSDWADYLKLFRNAGDARAVGEGSVCYLWSATAAKNIFTRIPSARIVMILRDPVERAFSQHLHVRAQGIVKGTFAEHVRSGLRARGGRYGVDHPFLELGLYAEQVSRFRSLFPPENIRIFEYSAYGECPQGALRDVFRFLGIDTEFMPDTSRRELEGRLPIPGVPRRLQRFVRPLLPKYSRRPAMTPEEVKLLADYYSEDTAKLSSLVDFDISHWLSFPVQ